MITLTIIAFNDAPADGSMQVQFDELGGTIGRADSNQLVLPDPDRVISRVAAQIVYRNGAFAIIDRGSNPIKLNGVAMASGREAALAAGDSLRIGGYDIKVSVGGPKATASSDPFADLLGPTPTKPNSQASLIDPLLRGPSTASPAPSSSAPFAPPPAPSAAPNAIPNDWDPFAPKTDIAAAAPSRPAANALGLDLGAAAPAALIPELSSGSSGPSSLDQMFGLKPSMGDDPLADSVLDAPLAQPNMAAHADPLRSLSSAPQASGEAIADDFSDLHRPFIPPTILGPVPPAAKPSPPSDAPRPPERMVPAPANAVMSWDEDHGAGHAVIESRAPLPVAPPPADPLPVAQRDLPASPPIQSADTAALLEAFRRGLNTPSLDLPALTPAVMELLGQIVHETARGMVDLLGARATVKRGLGAEATTIVPKHNNPLKFSPNAEFALQHLLSPPARGFIPAAAAMRDAFNDLRAHQIGVVAGMQAALEATLQRFDPTEFSSQPDKPSMLDSLLPANRKGRLWDLYVAHFAKVRDEARDDINSLSGEAFLTAYDDSVRRLLTKLAEDAAKGAS